MISYSLDVEGSEFQILKTIPFQDVDIKVLDIEIDRAGTIFPGTYEDISKYLDMIFIHKLLSMMLFLLKKDFWMK